MNRYEKVLFLTLLMSAFVGTAGAENPSEDFQKGFQAGWKTFWGSHEYKDGKALLSTTKGKTHMGFNHKVTFDPKQFPTVEVAAVGGDGGWSLIVKPVGGKGPRVLTGKGPGVKRAEDWYKQLEDPKEQEYELLLSVGGDIVIDRVTFYDKDGNAPAGHNEGETPWEAKDADDDPDGVKKAAADSAKRIAERGGPDYTIARRHAAQFPAVPQLHKAGVDESLFANGKGVVLKVDDMASLKSAWDEMKRSLAAGRPTKLQLAEGVYRFDDQLEWVGPNETAARTPLVIEGVGPGKSILAGSYVIPGGQFSAVPGEAGLYVSPWRHDWGMFNPGRWGTKDALAQRREVVAVNGQRLWQRLLQEYDYDKANGRWVAAGRNNPSFLKPGEFAIDDEAGKLYFRAPEGMQISGDTSVEVGQTVRILLIEGKHNMVIRGLTFQHAVGWQSNSGPLTLNRWNPEHRSRNVLIEDCLFTQNGNNGLQAYWLEDSVIRNVTATENGGGGLSTYYCLSTRVEDSEATHNGWRNMSGTGVNPAGRSLHYLRVKANRNYGRGQRQDHILNGALFEDCEFNHNTSDGAFNEIAVGPVTYKGCDFIGNGHDIAEGHAQGAGLFILAVDHLTVEDCRFINNAGAGFSFEGGGRTWNEAFTPGKFKKDEPSLPGYTNYTFRNNVFAADDPDSLLIARWWNEAAGKTRGHHKLYTALLTEELESGNNTFWHATRKDVFDISERFHGRNLTDLEGWREYTGEDKDSVWKKPQNMPQAEDAAR